MTNVIRDINEVSGIDYVTVEERSDINNLIQQANAERTNKLTAPSIKKVQPSQLLQDTSKSQKRKCKSINIPSTASKMTELRKQIHINKPLIIAVCEELQRILTIGLRNS